MEQPRREEKTSAFLQIKRQLVPVVTIMNLRQAPPGISKFNGEGGVPRGKLTARHATAPKRVLRNQTTKRTSPTNECVANCDGPRLLCRSNLERQPPSSRHLTCSLETEKRLQQQQRGKTAHVAGKMGWLLWGGADRIGKGGRRGRAGGGGGKGSAHLN